MKTIYIPKGETIRYESLATEHLVVHGCLQVSCGITAKTITGYGTVHAGTVNADVIRVDDMDAGSIVCKRLLAKRVQSPEVFASESAAVSCFLSAAYVETGKLTVTLSEIDTVNAAEIVNLAPKKRTLFGTLLASAFRSIWTVLTVPGQKELKAMQTSMIMCERMLLNRCRKKSKNLWQRKLYHARQKILPSLNLWMKNSIESSAFSSWRVSRATPSSSSPARRRKMHPCSILSMSVSSATLRKSLCGRSMW